MQILVCLRPPPSNTVQTPQPPQIFSQLQKISKPRLASLSFELYLLMAENRQPDGAASSERWHRSLVCILIEQTWTIYPTCSRVFSPLPHLFLSLCSFDLSNFLNSFYVSALADHHFSSTFTLCLSFHALSKHSTYFPRKISLFLGYFPSETDLGVISKFL